MCFLPDKNAGQRQADQMRFAGKMNALKGRESLWHSKGAHTIIGLDRNVRKYTSSLSNIKRRALFIHGQTLKKEEGFASKWAKNVGRELDVGTYASRAKGAGRNNRVEILRKMAASRAVVDHNWREKADSLNYMAKQNFLAGRASLRSEQGLPPSHYDTFTAITPKEGMGSRFLRSTMFAINLASGIQGLGNPEKFLE